MEPADAASVSRDLLEDSLPRRWSHVEGVARQATEVDGSSMLVAAAWLHDIGYAPALCDTGFHPIDGARWLRRRGADPQIVSLVAHHSCARVEARLPGLAHVLEVEFPRLPGLPHDELCFCDLTTSPDGDRVDVGERIAEIRERYPDGHIVRQFIDEAEHELKATVARVAERHPK